MPMNPLEIEDTRRQQRKYPKSLILVFIGLFIAAIGFQFMYVGRESRLYAPIRERIGKLSSRAFALPTSSLAALKDKITTATTTTTTTAKTADQNVGFSTQNSKDDISQNFPVTQMELPTLFNLILAPYGEEAYQARVPSRPTLLYDLSFLNTSSLSNWDLSKSPSDKDIIYQISAKQGKESSSKSKDIAGKKAGRKQRF